MTMSQVLAPAAVDRPSALTLPATAPTPRSSGAHGLDGTLFMDVNHFAQHTGWLHPVMNFYANYGVVLFALLLVFGWWLARGRQDAHVMGAALWAGASVLLAVLIAQPINHAVAEARPWESVPHALILAGHSTDFSFPSDHGTMAGAATAGILIYHRKLGAVTAFAGVLICFARVYIGAHFPQDVAAGFVLGAAVALIGYAILRVPIAALVAFLSRTPLRPLLTAGPAPLPSGRGAQPAGAVSSGAAAGPS